MRKRQTEVPGTERQVIEEIEGPAAEWCNFFYGAKEMQEKARNIKPLIMEEMKKHGVEVYRYIDDDYTYVFTFTKQESLSCKRITSEEEE